METHHIKEEVDKSIDKSIEKLGMLRDEVRLKLHLASLDAKQEWNETLEPKVFEVEAAAKQITESTRSTARELIARLEEFLVRMRDSDGPRSTH